mgnify:CR=1 FL=1
MDMYILNCEINELKKNEIRTLSFKKYKEIINKYNKILSENLPIEGNTTRNIDFIYDTKTNVKFKFSNLKAERLLIDDSIEVKINDKSQIKVDDLNDWLKEFNKKSISKKGAKGYISKELILENKEGGKSLLLLSVLEKKLKKEIVFEKVEEYYVRELLKDKGVDDNALITLYNSENYGSDWIYKIKFLTDYVYENYSASIVKQYLTLFKRSKDLEAYYKKDLYDFNEEEMKSYLKILRAKTYNSITSKYSLIKSYIEIAKADNKGLVALPFGMLLRASDLESVIFQYAQENRYCTRNELEQGVKKLANPIDQVIFLLLYEGIMGKQYEDLRLLKVTDVDIKNRIVIRPSDGKEIKISKFTAKCLENAIHQTHYYRASNTDVKTPLDLTSPYVIKTKLTSTSNGECLKYTGLTRRLDVLKDQMEMPLLTAKTIYKSGLIERILIYEYENNKKLAIKDLKSLLNEWKELKEGGDLYKAKEIVEKQMIPELEEKKYIIK